MHEDARALLDHVMDLIAEAPDRKCALSRDDIVKLVTEVKCNFPEMPTPSTRAIGDAIKRRFGVEAGMHGASVGMYPGLVIKSGGAPIAHHLLIPLIARLDCGGMRGRGMRGRGLHQGDHHATVQHKDVHGTRLESNNGKNLFLVK